MLVQRVLAGQAAVIGVAVVVFALGRFWAVESYVVEVWLDYGDGRADAGYWWKASVTIESVSDVGMLRSRVTMS